MDPNSEASQAVPSVGPVSWRVRWSELQRQILRLQSQDDVERSVLKRLTTVRQPFVLAFVNAHAFNSVVHDEGLYRALRGFDVLLRDGSGMALHYRLRRQPPGLNLNGTDLIPSVIRRFDGRPIALLGTEQPYLDNARAAISRDLAPASAIDTDHGFHDRAHYVAWVRQHRPSLVVLGMGMPKQELVAMALRDGLDHPCVIVCGGAIIDFLGGKVTRSPAWLRRIGAEWLYRLALEPRRLFRRYVLGNPTFLGRSLLHRMLPGAAASR